MLLLGTDSAGVAQWQSIVLPGLRRRLTPITRSNPKDHALLLEIALGEQLVRRLLIAMGNHYSKASATEPITVFLDIFDTNYWGKFRLEENREPNE